MKKSLLSLLTLLAAFLCGFSASAQDWSTTVQWTDPGSIRILKGTSYSSATALEMPAGATSLTLTEADGYFIIPADGYAITGGDLQGSAVSTSKVNYNPPVYGIRINAQYTADKNKYNGKTLTVSAVKLSYSDFEVEVANGAANITCSLYDASGNNLRDITLSDGVNKLKFSNIETSLYLQSKSYPRVDFHSVKLNGAEQQQNNTSQKTYMLPLSAGCKVYIAVTDPALYQSCDVTFRFTNDNPDCLNNIRNWATSSFIMPAQLTADYKLVIDKGGQIQFNFNEDATVNSVKANGVVIENPKSTKITVNEDTEFVIDATTATYADLTAEIYTNDIEHINLSTSLGDDAEALRYEFVKDVPANTVTLESGFTIPIDTKLYKVTNISGKTRKFFFDAPAGYWLKDGVKGRLLDPQDNGHLAGTAGISYDETPVFFDVARIDHSTPACVFFSGPESSAKLQSKTIWGESASYGGQGDFIAPGWTDIRFDGNGYNASFTGRIIVDQSASGNVKTVVLDGTTVKPDEDDKYNMTFKENSVLKMFLGKTSVLPFNVTFDVAEGASATVVYDRVKTVTDFSAPVKNYGETPYAITPAANVVVKVNGETAEPVNGVISLSLTKSTVIALEQNASGLTLTGTLKPADKTTVRRLSAITYSFEFDGTHMIDMAADAASRITLSNGTETISATSIEPGEPSETEIPLVITFPTQTAAGTYTLSIPAGTFFQTEYDIATDSYVFGKGCAASAAVEATYTVDPAMTYKWSFTPADGSQNDLPGGAQKIIISLPDADTLSETPFTEATGPWVTYNGISVSRVEDYYEEDGWAFEQTYDTYGKPALAMFISENIMKTVGTLEITANAGAFTVDGNEASPELSFSARFGEVKDYPAVFLPENGTSVTSFDEIKLTFEGARSVSLNENEKFIIFSTGVSWGTQDIEISTEGNTVTFRPAISTTLAPGIYTLRIGEGTFLIDGVQPSSELSASWTLERSSAVDFSWTPSPEKNILNNGWGVSAAFVFGDIEKISYGPNRNDIKVYFNGTEIGLRNSSMTDDDMYFTTACGDASMPNVFMINAMGGVLSSQETEGTIRVVLPAGAILVSGEATPEPIEFTWNLVKMKDYVINVSPEPGTAVARLDEFTIEFANAETAETSEYFSNSWISLRKGYSIFTEAAEVSRIDGAAHPTFRVKLAKPAEEDGSYTLFISMGTFLLDGVQENDYLRYSYTVDTTLTGIDGILADDGLYTAVSLQGAVILRDASIEKVKALPAGLYIINGRKVCIR